MGISVKLSPILEIWFGLNSKSRGLRGNTRTIYSFGIGVLIRKESVPKVHISSKNSVKTIRIASFVLIFLHLNLHDANRHLSSNRV